MKTLKKHIFSDILRLPWSADHLNGGSGYDQTTTVKRSPERAVV